MVTVIVDLDLEITIYQSARQCAEGPTRAIGMMKLEINQSLEKDIVSCMEYESLLQAILAQTEDHKEGVYAFLNRRSPVFRGE